MTCTVYSASLFEKNHQLGAEFTGGSCWVLKKKQTYTRSFGLLGWNSYYNNHNTHIWNLRSFMVIFDVAKNMNQQEN
jgi:hypothetical protein